MVGRSTRSTPMIKGVGEWLTCQCVHAHEERVCRRDTVRAFAVVVQEGGAGSVGQGAWGMERGAAIEEGGVCLSVRQARAAHECRGVGVERRWQKGDKRARVRERRERVCEGGGRGQQLRNNRGEEDDRPLEQSRQEDEK